MQRLFCFLLLTSSAHAVTFITGQTLGTFRNNFGGWAGIRLHILQTVTTTSIGRYCAAADTSTHAVKFVLDTGTTPTDVAGSTVSVVCPGTAGYQYGAATVTLNKSSVYFLVSQEVDGTNGFYDLDTTVTPTGIAALDGAGWFDGKWNIMGFTTPRNTAFGPVNFQYTAPTPLTGVSIQDDRGDTTAATRYGVKARPPIPRGLKLYITGPDGCLVSGAEGGDAFYDTFYEDAGQGSVSQIPATTVPYTVYIRYQSEYTGYTGSVGNKVSTITFTLSGAGCSGSAVFTLTHVITNGNPLPQIVYRTPSGTVPGICSYSGLRDNSQCDYSGSDGMAAATPLILKNKGDTGTDAAWGHSITKVTSGPASLPTSPQGRDFHAYSAVTPFDRTNGYIWVETTGGSRGGSSSYVRLSDMTELRSGLDHGSNYMIPSTIYDGTVTHDPDGHTIRKRVINPTTGATISSDDYDVNVSPLFITRMSHGGTSDMSADGWWAFTDQLGDQTATRVCAVDMNGIDGTNYLTHIYCAPLVAAFGPDGIDAGSGLAYDTDTAHVTGVDVRTGKRYVVVYNNRQRLGIYTVNLTTHILDHHATPESPEGHEICYGSGLPFQHPDRSNGDGAWQVGECGMPAGHSDFADFDGKQYWVAAIDFNVYNQRWMVAMDIAAGPDMGKPVEFGGGLHLINYIGTTAGPDNHETCSPKSHICAWSFFKAGGTTGTATLISTISAANPAIITTSGGHGWANGAKTVVVGGLYPTAYRTCAMGKFAATVTDSTHITLTGANCSSAGAYSGGDGVVGDVFNNQYAWYGGEAQLADLHHVIRAINLRDYRWNGPGKDLNGYYSFPEAALSQDGTKLAFHSTIGIPEIQDYVADTGWSINAAIRPLVQPTHTGAVASLFLPVSGTCSWTVMTDSATTIQTINTPTSRIHHAFLTGETAGNNYLLRTVCGVYSATMPFRTAATPSGTAPVSPGMLGVTSAADIVFDYGTTAALGTTSAASPCSAGAQCRATASLAKGIWFIQPRIRNGSAATLVIGALTELRN